MHRDFFRWDLPLSMTSMCRDSKRNRKSNDDSVTDGRNYEQVAKEQRHDKKSRKMPPGERALSAVVSKNSNYALQFNYERPGSSDTPSHCPNLSIVGGHASQQYLAGNNFSLFPPNPQTNANLFKLPLNQNLEPSFQPLQTLPVNNMPAQTRQLDSAVINMSEMMGGDLNMADDPNDMVINGWNNFPSNRIKKAHNMMTNATAQGFGTSFDCSTSKPSISDGNMNEFNSSCFCSGGVLSPLAALAPNPDRDINLGPVDFRHSRTATSNRTYTKKNTIYTEDELSPLAVFAHKPNQGINIDEVKGICPWTFTSNRKYKENSTTGFYSEDSLSPLAASVPNTDRDIDQGKGRYPGIAASKRACMVHNKNGFYSGDALSPLAVFAPNTNRDVSQGQGEGRSPCIVGYKEKNRQFTHDYFTLSRLAVFGHSSVRNINQGHADPISFRSTTMGNRAEKENYDEIEEANEEEMDRDLSAFFARLEKSIWKNEYKSRHDIK